MPKVVLEFKVEEIGNVAIIAAKTEEALARVQKAAAQTTVATQQTTVATRQSTAAYGEAATAAKPYAAGAEQVSRSHTAVAQSSREATVSMRDMKQAVGAVAQVFGQASPQLALATMELSKFTGGMKDLPTMAKITSGALLGVGAAVSYLVATSAELERVETRFAAVGKAGEALAGGTVRQMYGAATLEREAVARRQQTGWVGWWQEAVTTLGRGLLGSTSRDEEAAMTQLAAESQLRKVLPFERRQVQAQTAMSNAESGAELIRSHIQSGMGSGTMNEPTVTSLVEVLKADVRDWVKASDDLISVQEEFAKAEAKARGTLSFEEKDITGRFGAARTVVYQQGELKTIALDEQLRQQKDALAQRAEQTRAMGAQMGLEAQGAAVESRRAEQQVWAPQHEAYNKWRMTTYGSSASDLNWETPGARQLIQAETDLKLAAIDETTTKELASIRQLGVAEAEKARLIAQAQTSGDAQRQAALDTAYARTHALVIEAAKLGEAATAAGAAITNNITSALEDALREAESLTEAMKSGSGASSTTSGKAAGGGGGGGGVGMSDAYVSADAAFAKARIKEIENRWGITIPADQADQYIKRQVQGGVGQTEQEAGWARIGLLKQQATTPTLDIGYGIGSPTTGSDAFNNAAGGVVPGPIGSPQRGTAHGGEVIGAPEQIVAALAAALERTGGRGRGGNLNVVVQIDGRQMMQALEVPLEDAIATGRVNIGGRRLS